MQLCCGGWGDVTLPLEADQIEPYVRSCQGREPVPEWLVDILSRLVKDGSPTFKPLKISEYQIQWGSCSIRTNIDVGPCSYIRYQDVPNMPANFVALGDSFLQLNPIYAYVSFGYGKASSVSVLNWCSNQQARLQQGDDGCYHAELSAD